MDLKAYCDANGVPYQQTNKGLRVMDTSLLPGSMRDGLDEKGFVVAAPVVESAPSEPVGESDEPKPKGKKK